MALIDDAGTAYAQGDFATAARLYRDILQVEPENSIVYQMLGAIALRQGRDDLALQLCDAALHYDPKLSAALINKSIILRKQGKKPEAKEAARLATDYDPTSGAAWGTLSYLELENRHYPEALDHAEKAIQYAPDSSHAWLNHANSLLAHSRLKEAYQSADKALKLSPDEAVMHYTKGQILRAAGYPDRAIPYFDKAIALRPDFSDALLGRALASFVMGESQSGWDAWEQRPYDKKRFAAIPRWTGDPVERLLIYGEQGMGDTIHFMRWLSLVKDKAQKIIFQVPVPIAPIVQKTFPDITVITPLDPLPPVDAFCLLMSIPLLFKVSFAEKSAPTDLPVSPAARTLWREKIASVPYPRIGIVWSGNPNHSNDFNRSMPFDAIKPLIDAYGPHLISLQDGKIKRLSPDADWKETAAAASSDPIDSTLALIKELDLVITVDTLVAHLAATTGCPTWIMLAFDPDWRWFLGRNTSLWYPSVRLFRQHHPKEWPPLIKEIMMEIAKLKDGDPTPLTTPEESPTPFLKNHPSSIPLEEPT